MYISRCEAGLVIIQTFTSFLSSHISDLSPKVFVQHLEAVSVICKVWAQFAPMSCLGSVNTSHWQSATELVSGCRLMTDKHAQTRQTSQFVFRFSTCNPLQVSKGCCYAVYTFRSPWQLKGVCGGPTLSHPNASVITHLWISAWTVSLTATVVLTPQVFLPLQKWEAAWLGWLSAVPVPKTTFLKGLCSTWGFNFVILPKNAEKKPHKLLHCLGWSHGGIPARLTVTQAESGVRKGLRFWDALQFLNKAVVGSVYSVSSWRCASHSDLS